MRQGRWLHAGHRPPAAALLPGWFLRRDQAEAVAKGICAARQAAPVARLLALDGSAEPGDLRYGPPDVLDGKVEGNRRPVAGEWNSLRRVADRHRALNAQ